MIDFTVQDLRHAFSMAKPDRPTTLVLCDYDFAVIAELVEGIMVLNEPGTAAHTYLAGLHGRLVGAFHDQHVKPDGVAEIEEGWDQHG